MCGGIDRPFCKILVIFLGFMKSLFMQVYGDAVFIFDIYLSK